MLFAGVAPLSAQGAGEGSASPLVEHAQIGKLEAIGLHTNRIILARSRQGLNPATYQSYDTNTQTQVGGLGSVMRVSKIPPEAIGEVVVMRYVSPGEHFLARRVYFTGAREIRETGGSEVALTR